MLNRNAMIVCLLLAVNFGLAEEIRRDPAEEGAASLLDSKGEPRSDAAKPQALESPKGPGGAPGNQRDIVGSVVFAGPSPNFGLPTNGGEFTEFRQFDDFVLNASTRIQSVRFWSVQAEFAPWDGQCFFQIFANGAGNLPSGSSLVSGFVDLRRTFLGVTTDDLDAHQNDFDIPSLTLNPGRYWLALRLSGDCSGQNQIFWLRGAPLFGFSGLADRFCDGTVDETGLDYAFRLYGASVAGSLCQDLEHPGIDPFFTDDDFPSLRLGVSDRAIAVEMNSELRVNALGIFGQIGQSGTLNVWVRAVNGTSLGAILGQGSANYSAGSVGFYNVPIDFTFEAGQRYDIAFNMSGGWGNPSPHILELYDFNNQTLNSANGFNSGPFKVLDGRSGADGYANSVMPHVRACIAPDAFEAYGLDLENQKLVGFNLATPQTLTFLAALPFGSDWSGCDFRPGTGTTTLFTLDNDLNRLQTINVQTGVIADIGAVTPTAGEALTGLSFDPSTGNLYASATNVGVRSTLYRINPSNGSTTTIGSSTAANGIIGIAIDQAGTIYGIDIQSDSLVTISKTNGATAQVGGLGININFTEGLDFDPATGILYGALVNDANDDPGLYTIDTANGQASLVGLVGTTFPGSSPNAPTLGSLAIAKDVTLTPTPSPSPTASPTASPSPSVSPTPSPFNGAAFDNHTAPATMETGADLIFGVTMQNTGTTTWTAAAGHSLGILSDPCSLYVPASNRVGIDSNVSVAPGEFYQFVLPIQAPGIPAICAMQFRMVQEFVEFFGPTVPVSIQIVFPTNAAVDWAEYE